MSLQSQCIQYTEPTLSHMIMVQICIIIHICIPMQGMTIKVLRIGTDSADSNRTVFFTYETELILFLAVLEYKYLSWVYGVDRKICHEGH